MPRSSEQTVIARLALALLLAPACSEDPVDAPTTEGVPDVADPDAQPPADLPGTARTPDSDGTAAAPARPARWPVENVHLTSYFGWRTDPVSGLGVRLHRGIDLRGKTGDLVMTIADGTVRFVGHDPLLGNLVIIDHGHGVESFYGHLSDFLVHEGLPLQRGAAIGLVGNTGRSAAPHLHLTVKVGGVSVDPLLILGQPIHRAPGLSIERPRPGAP